MLSKSNYLIFTLVACIISFAANSQSLTLEEAKGLSEKHTSQIQPVTGYIIKDMDKSIKSLQYDEASAVAIFKLNLGNGKKITMVTTGVLKKELDGYEEIQAFGVKDKDVFITSYIQPAPAVEMATGLRSNGMIYVVVIGVLIVLMGLIIYMIMTNVKLNKTLREIDE